jgi:hypothetical protein
LGCAIARSQTRCRLAMEYAGLTDVDAARKWRDRVGCWLFWAQAGEVIWFNSSYRASDVMRGGHATPLDRRLYPANEQNCRAGHTSPVVRNWPLRIICMSSTPARPPLTRVTPHIHPSDAGDVPDADGQPAVWNGARTRLPGPGGSLPSSHLLPQAAPQGRSLRYATLTPLSSLFGAARWHAGDPALYGCRTISIQDRIQH